MKDDNGGGEIGNGLRVGKEGERMDGTRGDQDLQDL